jgi:hypothetical protein
MLPNDRILLLIKSDAGYPVMVAIGLLIKCMVHEASQAQRNVAPGIVGVIRSGAMSVAVMQLFFSNGMLRVCLKGAA